MKNIITKIVTGIAFIMFVASPVLAVTTPVATPVSASCTSRLLGMPAWYRGLTKPDCSIKSPTEVGGVQSFIAKIALNIIEAILFLIGYIATAFIIYGGFLFLTGGSNASQIEKARKSILNAAIGLMISIASIAIVNYIFTIIG